MNTLTKITKKKFRQMADEHGFALAIRTGNGDTLANIVTQIESFGNVHSFEEMTKERRKCVKNTASTLAFETERGSSYMNIGGAGIDIYTHPDGWVIVRNECLSHGAWGVKTATALVYA